MRQGWSRQEQGLKGLSITEGLGKCGKDTGKGAPPAGGGPGAVIPEDTARGCFRNAAKETGDCVSKRIKARTLSIRESTALQAGTVARWSHGTLAFLGKVYCVYSLQLYSPHYDS